VLPEPNYVALTAAVSYADGGIILTPPRDGEVGDEAVWSKAYKDKCAIENMTAICATDLVPTIYLARATVTNGFGTIQADEQQPVAAGE
jgi:hypothetical protein